MDPETKRQIEEAVREALSLHGVTGTVVASGRQLELHGNGPPISIELDKLGDQWSLLPEDIRARKAGDLAKRLVDAQRAGGAKRADVRAPAASPQRVIVLPIGGLVLLLVVVFVGVWALRGSSCESSPAPATTTKAAASVVPGENDADAKARRARACEASRKRIYAGASVGPFEMDGWVVELWMAKKRAAGSTALPADDTKVRALVGAAKLGPEADDELAKLSGGTVEIAAGFSDSDQARSPAWSASSVRFSGAYSGSFFDAKVRPRFVALADRVATAADAEMAALYARCAHLTAHDVGAWYRGVESRDAVAALVFSTGAFAESPVLNRGAITALGKGGELDGLIAAAGDKADRATLTSLLGEHGGSVSEGTSGVTLTFPLGGPTRAMAATRVIAKKMGLGAGD